MFRVEKIQPVFNGIITTANRYPKHGFIDSKTGLIDSVHADKLKEYQTIIAVGPAAANQGFKAGQIVFLNYLPYYVRKHQTGRFDKDQNTIEDITVMVDDVPTYTLYNKENGTEETVMYLYDRDIIAVVEGEEILEKEVSAAEALEIAMLAGNGAKLAIMELNKKQKN